MNDNKEILPVEWLTEDWFIVCGLIKNEVDAYSEAIRSQSDVVSARLILCERIADLIKKEKMATKDVCMQAFEKIMKRTHIVKG